MLRDEIATRRRLFSSRAATFSRLILLTALVRILKQSERAPSSALFTAGLVAAALIMTSAQRLQAQTCPCPGQNGVNHRSIGTTTGNLASGTASITIGTKTATFGASLPATVGRGDELVIGGETFYILTVDTPTQVTVQTAALATHSDEAYAIQRAYNAIQTWENARDGNLVSEDRLEIGVAYNDGTFNGSILSERRGLRAAESAMGEVTTSQGLGSAR